MNQTTLSQSDKDFFLNHASLFLETFEPSYIDYFTALSQRHMKSINREEARACGHDIYQTLFKCDFDITALRNDILERTNYEKVVLDFLISRSSLYMLEAYVSFTQTQKSVSYSDFLVLCLNRFIALFEVEVVTKTVDFSSAMSVGFSKDVMFTPTNHIIEAFAQMKADGNKVTFLNLYKGVPISSAAEVLDVEGENVTFKIERLQEIAMKLDGQAFIVKNDYFDKHLKADIVSSDFHTNRVILRNFMYMLNMPALQRAFTRVHPDIIANVYLNQVGNVQTKGRLYDLSMSGMGVVSEENNGVFVGAKVSVSFELNSASVHMQGDKTIEVQGEIVNVIEYTNSYRYCMRIFPDPRMREKLFEYISKREKEILEELNSELEYLI